VHITVMKDVEDALPRPTAKGAHQVNETSFSADQKARVQRRGIYSVNEAESFRTLATSCNITLWASPMMFARKYWLLVNRLAIGAHHPGRHESTQVGCPGLPECGDRDRARAPAIAAQQAASGDPASDHLPA
jgi:hypothetical protein